MKAIEKYLCVLFVVVSCGILFGSCDDPDNYGGNYRLQGTWALIEDEYGPINWDQDCDFDFYGNGNGTYSCYDEYGAWQTYPISWDADGRYLTVYAPFDTWYYTYRVTGNLLYLYPTNGDPYLIFQAY